MNQTMGIMSDNRRPSSPSNRRSILAGACAVAAVLGAGALVAVQLTDSDDSQRTSTPAAITSWPIPSPGIAAIR